MVRLHEHMSVTMNICMTWPGYINICKLPWIYVWHGQVTMNMLNLNINTNNIHLCMCFKIVICPYFAVGHTIMWYFNRCPGRTMLTLYQTVHWTQAVSRVFFFTFLKYHFKIPTSCSIVYILHTKKMSTFIAPMYASNPILLAQGVSALI